jgi:hypothetical protein
VRALAADDRDLCPVDLLETQHVTVGVQRGHHRSAPLGQRPSSAQRTGHVQHRSVACGKPPPSWDNVHGGSGSHARRGCSVTSRRPRRCGARSKRRA